MTTYAEKQAARRQRIEARADKARKEAQARFTASDAAVAGIPPGQPILVGHHSERRHRAALDRSHRNMRKGLDAQAHARDLDRRAAAVGTGGISSDDENAAEKIRRKLADLDAGTATMKAINAAWRKHGRPEAADAEAWDRIAAELGSVTDWHALRAAMNRNFMNRPGKPRPPFESYAFSNNSAERRRLAQRLEDVEARQKALAERGSEPRTLHSGTGWEIAEDLGDNRLRVYFDHKPGPQTRALCKQHGFRWAPSESAWQRKITGSAHMNVRWLAEALNKQGGIHD